DPDFTLGSLICLRGSSNKTLALSPTCRLRGKVGSPASSTDGTSGETRLRHRRHRIRARSRLFRQFERSATRRRGPVAPAAAVGVVLCSHDTAAGVRAQHPHVNEPAVLDLTEDTPDAVPVAE